MQIQYKTWKSRHQLLILNHLKLKNEKTNNNKVTGGIRLQINLNDIVLTLISKFYWKELQ